MGLIISATILSILLLVCMVGLTITGLPWDSYVDGKVKEIMTRFEAASIGVGALLVINLILLFA